MATATESEKLQLDDISSVKNELAMVDAQRITADDEHDPELAAKADRVVDSFMNVDLNNQQNVDDIKSAVETMAYQEQREAAKQSALLNQPIKVMQGKSEEGGEVARSLIDLKLKVEELDPNRLDLEAGWFSRTLGFLPFIGTPLKRYFTKFESAQTAIGAIIKSLEIGRETLKRDNITLQADQQRLRELTIKLEKAVKLGQLLDQKVSAKLANEIPQDDPRYKFLQEEVLFALRQRILDLQQQLAVSQQGVLASEIVIRNNKELVRGVNRALNVTVNALQTAVTVAMALENQRIVLDKVNAVTQTTDSLIAGTAKRLRTQGAEIHKQASSTALSIDTLKQAFVDINAAMDDIAQFRVKALPQMAQSIAEMDELSKQAEESIQKMEKSNKANPAHAITVD